MQTSQQSASKAIRLHLAARNKSQSWLAERLGVSPFWVSRRMSGVKDFDVNDLDRIAAVFDTSLVGLMGDADALVVDAGRVEAS